ncbi:MAG: hypothetical protein NVS1B7_2260 [Candidatus Saccharimonadales bacterium]
MIVFMKYALGVLAVIVVAFIAIILVTTRSTDTGNNANSAKKPAASINILDADNGSSAVKVTTQGHLIGEEQRRSVRITVSQSQRTVEILSGYEENITKSEVIANTPAAYSTFLRALNNANFVKSRKVLVDDERGTCPIGNRYVYELVKANTNIRRLWSNSCASSEGSFAGNGPLIRELFQKQIPDYSKFMDGTLLSE